MKKTLFVCAAAAFLVSVVPVHAQSLLADAARREAARRKAVNAASVPTYTNEDLSRLPPRMAPPMPKPSATEVITLGPAGNQSGPPAGAAAQTGAAAPAGQPAAAAAPAPRDEKYWRERIGAVRTSLARAEIFAEALQSRINALSADIVNRDDPAQRQLLMQQRQTALDEFDRVKKEIVELMKEIAEIEDEARRLNVPPGWLR